MKTYKVKSITVSKKPGGKEDNLRTAFIGLFQENNPHLIAKPPLKVIEIKDVEKVRFRDLRNVSFYLVGNDIVINDLTEINIDYKDYIVTLTGKRKLPES